MILANIRCETLDFAVNVILISPKGWRHYLRRLSRRFL